MMGGWLMNRSLHQQAANPVNHDNESSSILANSGLKTGGNLKSSITTYPCDALSNQHGPVRFANVGFAAKAENHAITRAGELL
jgi:hypothetical protein